MTCQRSLQWNIKRIYAQATKAEVVYGLRWYASANRMCRELAEDHGITMVKAVGVVAALSPNVAWAVNVGAADKLIRHWRTGGTVETVMCAGYGANKRKAWAILEIAEDTTSTEQIRGILRGPKVTAFYYCILGDPDAVCIDGHAYNISRGARMNMKDVPAVRDKVYDGTAEAFRKVAQGIGIAAYELQAITWVTWRRLHSIA